MTVPSEVIREGLSVIERLIRSGQIDTDGARDLSQFAHQLGAAHATEVLERFASVGSAVPNFLLTAFAPFVSENDSSTAVDPSSPDDQHYRRWLAGLTTRDDGHFARRLAVKTRAIGHFDT